MIDWNQLETHALTECVFPPVQDRCVAGLTVYARYRCGWMQWTVPIGNLLTGGWMS